MKRTISSSIMSFTSTKRQNMHHATMPQQPTVADAPQPQCAQLLLLL
jgi:hypothetical protein